MLKASILLPDVDKISPGQILCWGLSTHVPIKFSPWMRHTSRYNSAVCSVSSRPPLNPVRGQKQSACEQMIASSKVQPNQGQSK